MATEPRVLSFVSALAFGVLVGGAFLVLAVAAPAAAYHNEECANDVTLNSPVIACGHACTNISKTIAGYCHGNPNRTCVGMYERNNPNDSYNGVCTLEVQ